MEKVKLTQKQADAIEDLLKQYGDREILIHEYLYLTGEINNNIEVIKRMNYDTFFGALYVGYEVEPEFKVGDWVFIDYGEAGTEIGFIKGWINEPHSFYIDKCHFGANVNEARHATPEEIAKEKERRWFAKHDRKPWELKEGDILSEHGNCRTQTIFRVCPLTKSVKFYGDVEWTRKYEIRSNYLVACFAEERKDV